MKHSGRLTPTSGNAIKDALASVAAMRSLLEESLEANLTAATTAQLGLLRILDLMKTMRTDSESNAIGGEQGERSTTGLDLSSVLERLPLNGWNQTTPPHTGQ